MIRTASMCTVASYQVRPRYCELEWRYDLRGGVAAGGLLQSSAQRNERTPLIGQIFPDCLESHSNSKEDDQDDRFFTRLVRRTLD
jgi:hypothetical protein